MPVPALPSGSNTVAGIVYASASILFTRFDQINVESETFGLPDLLGGPAASIAYTFGTGAQQINLIHCLQYALVASTPQTIDLTSLLDPSGASINFARTRELMWYNPDPTAGHDVTIYRGASNGFLFLPDSSHPETVHANGGFLRKSDQNSTGGGNGMVTGGSSKTIVMDPGSHNVTIGVLILGGNAA